jgi:hypothetical protein
LEEEKLAEGICHAPAERNAATRWINAKTLAGRKDASSIEVAISSLAGLAASLCLLPQGVVVAIPVAPLAE